MYLWNYYILSFIILFLGSIKSQAVLELLQDQNGIPPVYVGRLHNQIAEQLHTKMLEQMPSTEKEYLDMALQQTIEIFCLPDDMDCKSEQTELFHQTVYDIRYGSVRISNLNIDYKSSVVPRLKDKDLQTYFEKIVDCVTSITLENKEEQLDKIRKISTDIESSENVPETTVAMVQGVASVAVSSTKLWTEHLMNPESAYFIFIQKFLNGNNQKTNLRNQSQAKLEPNFDSSCMMKIISATVLRDISGGINVALQGLIKLMLLPNPTKAFRLGLKTLRGSVTSSLAVVGIDVPSNLELIQMAMGDFNHDESTGPTSNITAICNPFYSNTIDEDL